jgi:phosphatidylserine/phosphatidylglycerophosphate/cardiolipin synthase-like enzyme
MDLSDILARADRAAGEKLEKAVRHHHYRRLRKLGWQRILDTKNAGPKVPGNPPVRQGNSVRILIDGAAAFPEMERAMRKAHSHIHLANWVLSPDFHMTRPGTPIRELLAELAATVSVRVLLWAGPPMPWTPLGRPKLRALRDELTRGTRIECLLDPHERPLHTHHEKIIVIDDELAYVGGLDPTHFTGDRYDSSKHPLREGSGWHDMAAELRGPAVADVAAHFNLRWHAVSGTRLPVVRPGQTAGSTDVQVLSTIPERIYPSVPRGVFRILDGYRRAFASAQQLIYIENQFLWSPEIVAVLRQKLLAPPSDDFRVLMLLPAKAALGTDDTRGQLGALLGADHDKRLLACTIYSRAGARSSPIYVHAKLAVVDDRWLTVGSANLNDHSLFNDTELNLAVYDSEIAQGTRQRLWAEHLELQMADVSGPPAAVIDELWRPIAEKQHQRRVRGEPPTHRVTRLPGVSHHSERLLGPLQGLFLDG